MRGQRLLLAGFLGAGLTCVLGLAAPDPAPPPAAEDTSRWMLNPGAFTTAEVCGGCHKDIHAGWSESIHARAYSNPRFQASLRQVQQGAGSEMAKRCLSCHAPTTLRETGTEPESSLAAEGVTCSFCHAITAAQERWSMDAYTIEPGQKMRGPFMYAVSPGHDTEYSPLHRTGLICAPCHQYSTDKGVAILNTYEEWKEGPWPKQGVQCQDCHMAPVPGAVADLIEKPAQAGALDRRIVNLHRLVGGSSLGQLRRALTVKVREAKRERGTLIVTVEVRNAAAGHRVPTGIPTRSVVLSLEASQRDRTFYSNERIYRRDILDASGKPLTTAADLFVRAARAGKDTRIAPGEIRTERFAFAAPPGVARVVLGLDYVAREGPGAPRRRERLHEETLEIP